MMRNFHFHLGDVNKSRLRASSAKRRCQSCVSCVSPSLFALLTHGGVMLLLDHDHHPPSRFGATSFLSAAKSERWSLWSDSHRRLRAYKTRPVAAEAQRQNGVHGRTRTCDLHLLRIEVGD